MVEETGETMVSPVGQERQQPQTVDQVIGGYLDEYVSLLGIKKGEERDRKRQELDRVLVDKLSEVAKGGREEAQQLVNSRVRSATTLFEGLQSQAQVLKVEDQEAYRRVEEQIEGMRTGVFPIETPASARERRFEKAA